MDRFGWSGFLRLNDNIVRELTLFIEHAPALNGFPLLQEFRQRAIQDLLPSAVVIAGDASASGVCVYSLQAPSRFFFQDVLSPEEMSLSSGHRELLTQEGSVRGLCAPPLFRRLVYRLRQPGGFLGERLS